MPDVLSEDSQFVAHSKQRSRKRTTFSVLVARKTGHRSPVHSPEASVGGIFGLRKGFALTAATGVAMHFDSGKLFRRSCRIAIFRGAL